MKESFFGNNRIVNSMLVVIFLLALGIRLLDLTDLPKEFGMPRQMYSFIKARGMYYEMARNVPEWQREIAIQQLHAQVALEPPAFERIVAFTYLTSSQTSQSISIKPWAMPPAAPQSMPARNGA